MGEMANKERRIFTRYQSQYECIIDIGLTRNRGKVIDYSVDGLCVITKNDIKFVQGAHVNIKISEIKIDYNYEIVWLKELGTDIKVGLKIVDGIKGSLKHLKLSDILIGLQRSTKTGVLTTESNLITKKIFINNGDMIFASSDNEDDRLGEFLLKKGKISLEHYEQASLILIKTRQRLGKILIELGCITPKELFREVQNQIEEIILSLFTIEEGQFSFKEMPIADSEVITLQISAANIIYKGIRKINNFAFLRQMCPPLDMVLNLSSDPLDLFQSLDLNESDKQILSYINGVYSLRTIIALSPLTDFGALRTICAFLNIGLIKIKEEYEAPVTLSPEESFFETQEVIPEEFLKEIEDMHNKCKDLGYYEILNVEKSASINEIQKAYYRAIKKFHPDKHFSLPSHDTKSKLINIFSYITEAYETLRNTGKRMIYNREIFCLSETTGQSKESKDNSVCSEDKTIPEVSLEETDTDVSSIEHTPQRDDMSNADTPNEKVMAEAHQVSDEEVSRMESLEIFDENAVIPEEDEREDVIPEEDDWEDVSTIDNKKISAENETTDTMEAPDTPDRQYDSNINAADIQEDIQSAVAYPIPQHNTQNKNLLKRISFSVIVVIITVFVVLFFSGKYDFIVKDYSIMAITEKIVPQSSSHDKISRESSSVVPEQNRTKLPPFRDKLIVKKKRPLTRPNDKIPGKSTRTMPDQKESIFTIQTGSYKNIASAEEQFGFLINVLDEKKLDYLRIEKIGRFYSVRIGKFKRRTEAVKFFNTIKPHLHGAYIMKAYFIMERVEKLSNMQ